MRIEGPAHRTARVGEPVALVATITDDGIPRARSREEFLAVIARRAQADSPLAALFGAGGSQSGASSSSSSPGGVPPALAARLFTRPPGRITVGKNLGLHLSWFVYRGAGPVQIEPAQIKVWEDTRAGANSPWAPIWFAPPVPPDGKITTQVRFDAPGTYVLRTLADDGALTSAEDITIIVTAAGSS